MSAAKGLKYRADLFGYVFRNRNVLLFSRNEKTDPGPPLKRFSAWDRVGEKLKEQKNERAGDIKSGRVGE